ncbi:MAG: hypothetical protein WAL45_14110 [Terracidiphilus sp.]
MEMRIFKRNAAIGVVAATFGFVAQAVAAQTVHIPDLAMLTTRVQQAHPEFVATRATLMAAIADYNVRARQLTSDCHGVDPDDQTRIENCQNRQAQLRVELRSLVGRATAFNASVDDALENAPYRPSGNGMVGGTGWIVGYNVPKPTPELIAKSRAMLAEQERLAGHTYADAIDFDHYNFVIGIAADTDFGWDLVKRVALPDEETAGQYSIENQPGYAALAGRSFNDLACHSNGAMVCLAALKCRDVKADNVTLYGPQITQEALEQWDGLVRSGQVKSVTLVMNSGDPVPPLSLAFGDYVRSRLEGRAETYENMALLETKELTSAINETAPRLLVHVYDCSFSVSDPLHCHGMATYKSEDAH